MSQIEIEDFVFSYWDNVGPITFHGMVNLWGIEVIVIANKMVQKEVALQKPSVLQNAFADFAQNFTLKKWTAFIVLW